MKKGVKIFVNILIAITTVACLVTTGFLFYRNATYRYVLVDGTSMENTLFDNDFGVMNISSSRKKHVKRFDIAIFDLEDDPRINEIIIKRIIGLPGEIVNISVNGDLRIDGKLIEQSFLTKEDAKIGTCPASSLKKGCERDFVVPENAFYVLGDNRSVSFDSRSLGALEYSTMLGVLKSITKHCEGEDENLVCKSITPRYF